MAWWNRSSKKQIHGNRGMFWGFGAQSFKFKPLYTADQNNQLLLDYFNNVAEVAAPLLKYSDGAKQVTFDTENKEVLTLLNKPNYYQGFDEFFSLLVLYKRLFGESIVDAFTPLKFGEGKKPQSLFLFNPLYVKIETNKKKDFRFNSIEQYIFYSGETDKDAIAVKEIENILHLKEVNPNFKDNQYLFGESRYAGCYRNIESIIEGYGAKVNLYKNGPRVYITGKSKGEFAEMAESEDIDEVQKRLKKYGWSEDKFNTFMTDVPLDVKMASLNVAQMQILPNNAADFQRLCDAQGMDSKIFSDNSSSTFSNKEAALSDFYNNSFRSEIDSTTRDLQTYLQTWWPDLKDLTPNYSQISEIVQANNEENERLRVDSEKGLITRNEYLEAIGKEERPEKEFNELYFLTANGWVPLTQNIPDE